MSRVDRFWPSLFHSRYSQAARRRRSRGRVEVLAAGVGLLAVGDGGDVMGGVVDAVALGRLTAMHLAVTVVSPPVRRISGSLVRRPVRVTRFIAAELGLVIGLREHGYVDAFRQVHGYGRRDRSWLYPNRKMGYRLDHVIVRGLHVAACEYEHAWRDERLSDHAAMWADVAARTLDAGRSAG
jgi:hypothetical protein